jgi:hypothetical protein
MPAFRFIGDPRCGGHGPDSIALFGLTFSRNDWTEVEGDLVERCARHSHLEALIEHVEPSALRVRSWATHDNEPANDAPRKRGRPRKVA